MRSDALEEPDSPSAVEPLQPRFLTLLALCSLLCLVPVWSVPVPPMADLPQHAAQVGLWKQLAQPGHPHADLYELNLFTPYLAAYLPARLLSEVMPPLEAIRCMVSLAVVSLPWSLLFLLRRVGGDPVWAFAGGPLAFGFAFQIGLLTYMLAVPLGLLYLAAVYAYAEAPSRRRGLLLGLLTIGLFFAHALVFGACGLAAAIVVAARSETLRERAARLAPLLLALPVVALWLNLTASGEPMTNSEIAWDMSLLRIPRFMSLVLGHHGPGLVGTALLSVCVVLGARRISPDPARWGPALLGAGLSFGAPGLAFGTQYVHHRLAQLGVLLLLLSLEPRARDDPRRARASALVIALALAWPFVLAVRFQDVRQETEDLRRVAAAVEPPCAVFTIVAHHTDGDIVGPYYHYGALLQPERPVLAEPSFCHNFPTLVRFRRGRWAKPPKAISQVRFERYDYLLVQSATDVRTEQPAWFAGQTWDVAARSGRWWLLRPRR